MFLLDPTPLLGAAAVVGDGGDVFDAHDLDAHRSERSDGGLTAGTGTSHQDVDLAHAVLHRPLGAGFGGQLGREGGGLAGALEPDVAGRGPGQHVALGIGDGDDGVVERALDMGHAVADVLALALARPTRLFGGLGHLLLHLLLPGHRLLRSLAGPGVGVGALAVHGQALAVPHALVAVDLHLALDVLGHVAAQVTLDSEVGVDVAAQARHLFVGEIADTGRGVDLDRLADLLRQGVADAENVGQGYLEPLLAGDIDSSYTGHLCPLLSPAAACGAGCHRSPGPHRGAG